MMKRHGILAFVLPALLAGTAHGQSPMIHANLWPAAASPAALSSTSDEARIASLIAKMTIEQKVGQVVQADITAITPADLDQYPLGSILAGGNSGPFGNERATPADWVRLVREFREASARPGPGKLAIPILFGVDAIHGHSNVVGATVFPHNVGLGAAHDPDLIRRIGKATAQEVAATGIEWTFAPTLAVPQDVRWGRSYEGYSSAPALVRAYATAMITGLQGTLVAGKAMAGDRVMGTAKHFLADGGTNTGKDQGDAQLNESDLIRVHAQGYPAAIDAGAMAVMASFSSWNGVKNHGNRGLLTDILKGRMGFKGFVVGDWNAHGQVPGCTVTDCPAAINAGLDMYMAPESWKGLFASLVRETKAGIVPMARLDDAVRRILRVKVKLGLLDGSRPATSGSFAVIGAPDHLALAREAVAKSLVLLKNNGGILPIRPGANVLVAGSGADNIAKQTGGWTISWQGTDTRPSDFPNWQSVWTGIEQAVRGAGGKAALSVDGSYAVKPDVAIVVYGENPYAEYMGDLKTLAYQPDDATDLALLKRLKAAGIPVVSVFLSGRPLWVSREINASDAFVAAWLPGTQGGGIADVLVARANGRPARDFSGKLSFAWPKTAASPIADPLFRLGYGLTYADRTRLPALSEEAGVAIVEREKIVRFLQAGHISAPWVLSVSDAAGRRIVGGGLTTSPAKAVSVASADLTAQEDARRIAFDGQGSVEIDGSPADFAWAPADMLALEIDWRIDRAPVAPVTFGLGGTTRDITGLLRRAPLGTRIATTLPLSCFAGADLGHVGKPFRLAAGRGLAVTLRGVTLKPLDNAMACPESVAPL